MKIPKIKEVLAMTDIELGEFLGHPEQLKDVREELAELDALKGKARDEAEDLWADRIAPKLDSYSLRWIKEDAIRAADPKKALQDTSPEYL